MNTTILRALLLDALYQVLDNKVFRILIVLVGLMVIFPLLVGFREENIVLLYGWRTFSYEDLFSTMGPILGLHPGAVSSMELAELQKLSVEAYQSIIIDGLMGSFGIFICLAATAFFVPQMIEKGAADTVFSKPVSRITLLLARYFTGILFVALLSTLLVIGTHLSLLVGSGISDPAFLWNALALTYKYGLVYAVTILVAVFTRSTVTSILLTIIFLTTNGCVHISWKALQMNIEVQDGFKGPSGGQSGPIRIIVDEHEIKPGEDSPTDAADHDSDGDVDGDVDGDADIDADEDRGLFLTILWKGFQALHYCLPKTGDASAIVEKFRGSFGNDEGSPYQDERMAFELRTLPEGFESIDLETLTNSELLFPPSEDGAIVFAAGQPQATAGARLLIHRRALRKIESSRTGRLRTESSKVAADAFEEWLEADETRLAISDDRVAIAEGTTWKRSVREYRWTAIRADSDWTIRTLIVKEGKWLATCQLEFPADHEPDEALLEHFGGRDFMFGSGSLSAANSMQDPDSWFAEKLDWTGDWRFTIWFSLASSLSFVLACLGVSWFRLSRMDF